ncbi:regulator [Halobacteriales archaeon SW_7_71_33]|nr:MAG: regulator [Halobacteriales archaeon SW_7_71_33]
MSTDAPETEGAEDAATGIEAVAELGRELGAAISDLEEYRVFEAKSEAVENDEDVQRKMDAFEEKRRELMLARQTGEATHEDMTELKQLQQELHSAPTMAEFLGAREALVERLETVNEAVSEPLAVDFGEEAGGCCQDE